MTNTNIITAEKSILYSHKYLNIKNRKFHNKILLKLKKEK